MECLQKNKGVELNQEQGASSWLTTLPIIVTT